MESLFWGEGHVHECVHGTACVETRGGCLVPCSVTLCLTLEREALAELLDEKLGWEPANPSSPPLSAPLSTGIVSV